MPKVVLSGSWFLSNWFFAYVYRIGYQAWKAPSFRDLNFSLREYESSRFNADKIAVAWKREKDTKETPSVLKALVSAYGVSYAFIGVYKVLWALFTWLAAYYFLKQVLQFVQNKDAPDFNGHMWGLAIFLSCAFSSISIHQLYSECNRVGIQVRAAISSLVYRKSLRLSRVRGGAGEVINILSSDMVRVVDCIVNFHFLWSAFLETLVIVVLACIEIGLSALPAIGFILLLFPLQMYLGKLTAETSRVQTVTTSERVHIMSEILTAIKLIKFYAWERPFEKNITEIRNKEMAAIYRIAMLKTVNFTVVFAVPVFVALASLGMWVGTGHKLTASVSFVVLSLFNTLRYPFFMLPLAVRGTVSALNAMARLDTFLDSEEVEPMTISANGPNEDIAFEIKDADFKWDGSTDVTLSNINLKVKKGAKVGIIGDVGAGKSSLIAALLGQIRQSRGEKLQVFGTTSYVPQEAWLLNTTLRDNVLFGMDYTKKAYKEVVRVCSLQRDLTLMLAGDMTEIAERGANLSGGQRQRVSLARAVYHDCEIVLLDDPLSAVDQHVGTHIFNECFMKHLKGKTVLMSIHQLQYLQQLDWIVMMKDGVIEKQGTYEECLTYPEFSRLIDSHVAGGAVEDEADDEAEIMNDEHFEIPEGPSKDALDIVIEAPSKKTNRSSNDANQLSIHDRNQLSIRKNQDLNEKTISSMIERNQLSVVKGAKTSHDVSKAIADNENSVMGYMSDDEGAALDSANLEKGKLTKEDKSTGASASHDWKAFLASGVGTMPTVAIMVFFFVVHGVRIGSDYWLRLWVPNTLNASDSLYIGVYGAMTVVFATGVFFRGYFFSLASVSKAKTLHDDLFHSVMRAPMSFFDATPLGRILSSFSKHQLAVDDTLADSFYQFLQYAPLGIGALILCSVTVPNNWIPSVIIVSIAAVVLYLSSAAESKTKALEAVTKPPVFVHLTATLEGLFSIRAYHAEKRFDDLNLEKLDRNHEALYGMLLVRHWIALNLDILSSMVVYFTTLMIVMNRDLKDMGSIGGLALSNALQMLVFVQWTVRMFGEVMGQMSSVGQLSYYGNNVESEAPAVIPETQPDAEWPSKGHIKFENVGLRYTEYGVKVLKDINFSIYPTEKIGIVGRTGSGKSTLLISLLRIVESCDGRVTIDGVDVSKIGLDELRTKIAIIPQEPVLFKGTVRSNLDPFNKSTDDQIWHALDAVHLGKIRDLPDKLDSAVIENGKNFSLGQRQLFCIARAILSRTKVLVLDEATANVSPETDMLIQSAIRENFKDVTVLTIAHRLNTIIDSDRVLVLDAGEILEYDDPVNLLKMKNGSFRDLVDQTGPATAQRLTEMAAEAQKSRTPKRPTDIKESAETKTKGKTTIQELAAGVKKEEL